MKKILLSFITLVFVAVTAWADSISIDGTVYNADILIKKNIGPGVTYTRLRLPAYPLNVNMLEVDLTNPYNRIETTVGSDKLGSTESLVNAATRQSSVNHRPLAAANANFWCTVEQPYATYMKGTPFGASVRNGKILTETNMSSNTWDGGAKRTGIVSIDKDKNLWIESMSWAGTAKSTKWGTSSYDIAQVNKMCNDNELVMYNSYYGTNRAFTITDNTVNRTDVFLMMKEGQTWGVNQDMVFVVKEVKATTSGNTLGSYDLCISGTGTYKAPLEQLVEGDEVTINHAWKSMATNDIPNLEQVVAGNAIVLKDGELTGRNTDETYNSQVYSRTGYGMSKDRKKLYVIVIDKSTDPVYGVSAGCGTKVMCQIAKFYDCWNLCTMDAGGSAQMMVQDKIINKTTESSPRAVANGWMIYSIAEPETEITSLQFADNELIAPIYSSYKPIIYGYDKYGNLINEDVKGFTLSCDATLGTTDGETFTAASKPSEGYLTATYNGITVKKMMSVRLADVSIRIKNLLIDGARKYPIEVIAVTNGNTYNIDAKAMSWNVTDPSIISIDKNAVITGLKEGTTTIKGTLGDFSDESNVTVQIAPKPEVGIGYDNWKYSSSNANTFEMNNNGLLSLNYLAGRAPSIKMIKDTMMYSLPDKFVIDFNSELPLTYILLQYKTANDNTIKSLSLGKGVGYTANVNNRVEVPISDLCDAEDLINYPITISQLTYYIGSATAGTKTIQFNSLGGVYNHSAGAEVINVDKASNLVVYSNPVIDGTLKVGMNNCKESLLELFNNAGVRTFVSTINFENGVASINVSNIQPGIYILRAITANTTDVNKIIIK